MTPIRDFNRAISQLREAHQLVDGYIYNAYSGPVDDQEARDLLTACDIRDDLEALLQRMRDYFVTASST